MGKIIIYTDGGARGNPGLAGAGYVFMEGDLSKGSGQAKVIHEGKKFLGDNITNNWAEYEAVALALKEAGAQGLDKKSIEIRMDSQLVVEQLSGNWKIKDAGLKKQATKVRVLLAKFSEYKFVHVPREKNEEADRLVNEAIDEAL
ncbi:MAG: ribonuclease HI family protein [bacterium]|nr:ribonuclease HI family protein [bacterium]